MAYSFKQTYAHEIITALKASGTLYLALFTTAPTATAAGTEVSGGGYARQVITLGTPSGGAASNDALITFPTATADWGTVVAGAICDAASGGNQKLWGDLDAAVNVTTGITVTVPIGAAVMRP